MLSSHAKFDENGFGMLIRDLENLYLYVGGSNDIRQDAQQSVTQDNSSPLSTPPLQLTGFDGIGGNGNLGQPALRQNVQSNQTPVSYPISVPNGGTGTTSLTAFGVMVGQLTNPVQTVSPGVADIPLVSNGAGNPSFRAPLITTATTGTLPVTRGGTGATATLSTVTVMCSNGANQIVQNSVGPPNTLLHGQGSASFPTWSAVDINSADVTGTLPIANGGTSATTAPLARTALGLGTIATQNANNVNITGGYLGTIFYRNRAVFTSAGTFTVPAGVFCILAVCVGAGGGGGGSAAAGVSPTINFGGGGGCGGGTAVAFLSVTPTSNLTIVIGTGGTAGGAGGGGGGNGGDSGIFTVVSGRGGLGGSGSTNFGRGGMADIPGTFLFQIGQFNSLGQPGESAFFNNFGTGGGAITGLSQGGGRGGASGNVPSGGTFNGAGGTGAAGGANSAGGVGQDGAVTIYY